MLQQNKQMKMGSVLAIHFLTEFIALKCDK